MILFSVSFCFDLWSMVTLTQNALLHIVFYVHTVPVGSSGSLPVLSI